MRRRGRMRRSRGSPLLKFLASIVQLFTPAKAVKVAKQKPVNPFASKTKRHRCFDLPIAEEIIESNRDRVDRLTQESYACADAIQSYQGNVLVMRDRDVIECNEQSEARLLESEKALKQAKCRYKKSLKILDAARDRMLIEESRKGVPHEPASAAISAMCRLPPQG
jgi:hypothetical protein